MSHQQSKISENTKKFNDKDLDFSEKNSYQHESGLNKKACGCGCGVRAKPRDEEIIDIEEDVEY